MGREIRKVPPHWVHPKGRDGKFEPLHEGNFNELAQEWMQKCMTHKPEENDGLFYWEYDGEPPCRESYVDYRGQEPTWFQVYETVSEGTPVTPPFATKEKLVNWLVEKGESYGTPYVRRFERETAENFVNESGWVPSFAIMDGKMYNGIETVALRK